MHKLALQCNATCFLVYHFVPSSSSLFVRHCLRVAKLWHSTRHGGTCATAVVMNQSLCILPISRPHFVLSPAFVHLSHIQVSTLFRATHVPAAQRLWFVDLQQSPECQDDESEPIG
jgi:hypothetical protein